MLSDKEFLALQESIKANLIDVDGGKYSKEDLQGLFKNCSTTQITELLYIKADDSQKTILDDLSSKDTQDLMNDLGLNPQQQSQVVEASGEKEGKYKDLLKMLNLIEQLQIAALEKDPRVAKLMEKDAITGKTPLHRDNDVEQFKQLLAGIPAEDQVKILKIRDNDGKTPLDYAKPEDLEKLLGDLKLNSEQKLAVLMEMHADSKKKPGVATLIDKVMKEQDAIKILKEQSPDLGLSPLHRANGKIDEIAKSLKDIPAADQVTLLKLKDKSGRTPFDYVNKANLKPLLDVLKLDPKQQYEALLNAKEVEVFKEAYNIQRDTPKSEDRFEMLKMKRDVDGKTMLHIPNAAEDMKPLLIKDLAPAQITTLLKTPNAEGKTPLDNIPSNKVMELLNDQELGLAPKQKYEAILNMKKSLNSQDIIATLSAGVKLNSDSSKDVTEKLEMLKMQREADGKTFLHGQSQQVMSATLKNIQKHLIAR